MNHKEEHQIGLLSFYISTYVKVSNSELLNFARIKVHDLTLKSSDWFDIIASEKSELVELVLHFQRNITKGFAAQIF